MTETAHYAQTPYDGHIWHVDIHFGFTAGRNMPHIFRADVAHGVPGDSDTTWFHNGISTFEGPTMEIPRAEADLIPYLLYHILQARDYLTQEHVMRELGGTEEKISADVGVSPPRNGLRAVQ